MKHSLGIMREFNTARFRVIADAIEEGDVDLSWDDTGDVRAGLESGEFIVFIARVRVYCDGEEIAADYLGGCIYRDFDAFMDHKECGRQNKEHAAKGESGRCGSYFHDMIREACSEARKALRKMQSIRVRG